MFNPGDVPAEEQKAIREGSSESATRNAGNNLAPDGAKASVASMGVESAVSLPNEE